MDEFITGFACSVIPGSLIFYWLLTDIDWFRGKYDDVWTHEEFKRNRRGCAIVPIVLSLLSIYLLWLIFGG